jgi:hypothetical protein
VANALVWSERVEPGGGGYKDCTYSSALSLLVFAGKKSFPLGIYTVAEREALERSDDQPDETGASQVDITTACKRRYRVTLRTVPTSLATALTKVGTGLTVAGRNGNLPAGHTLRRWQPGFIGGHCVCIIPLGNGRSRWLDPLAPNKYAGDIVNNSTILQWAYGGSANMRYLNEDELAPVVVVPPVTEEDMILSQSLPGYTAVVKKTANVRVAPALNATVIRVVSTPETWAIIGAVKGQVDPEGGSDQWYTRWNVNRWEYTAKSNVPVAPVAPASAAALAAAKAEAATATAAATAAKAAAATATTALAACNVKVTNAKTALA